MALGMALAFALVVSQTSDSGPKESSSNLPSYQVYDPPGFTTDFMPKVSLSEVKFSFYCESSVYTELCNEQVMLSRRLQDEAGWLPKNELNPESQLNADQRAWLTSRLPESVGDAYVVYLPKQNQFRRMKLTGFVPMGVGVYYEGIAGRLEPLDEELRPSENNCARAIGLTIRGGTNATFESNPDKTVMSDEEAGQVLAKLRTLCEEPDLEYLFNQRVYFYYPTIKGFAVLVRGTERQAKYLFCVYRFRDAWEVAAVAWEDEIKGGMIFESKHLHHDSDLQSPELHMLPDLDGDGGSEMFITSDAQPILFSCSMKYVGGGGSRPEVKRVHARYLAAF